MSDYWRGLRTACLILTVGTAFAAVSTSPAHAINIADNYWGGTQTTSGGLGQPTTSDVIASNVADFQISSMDVTRIATGLDSSDLQIVIHTTYTPGNINTGFGDLFLSSAGNLGNVSLIGPAPYASDTFVANPARFDYVVDINNSTAPGTGGVAGNAQVRALAGDGSDVQLSFEGTDTTSVNAGGIRTGQAAYYTGSNPDLKAGSMWTFNDAADTLTILIKNEELNGVSLLGNGIITLAWSMTSASDVILVQHQRPVPLPAAFPLFATGLGLLGLLGRRRKRKGAAVSARENYPIAIRKGGRVGGHFRFHFLGHFPVGLRQTLHCRARPPGSGLRPARVQACAGHPRLAHCVFESVDGRDIGERSDAVLRTAMPGHDDV